MLAVLRLYSIASTAAKSCKKVSGIAVLIVSAIVTVLVMGAPIFESMFRYGTDGYFVVIHWHFWTMLWVFVLAFSVSFFWQYRPAR